ncbi:MAG: hypothetical protein QOH90_2108 [Actinomycetota bacterium]|jgi:hypothetical protein|nr:hypothetical protein [Actinomycetota bacterium]
MRRLAENGYFRGRSHSYQSRVDIVLVCYSWVGLLVISSQVCIMGRGQL